MKVNSNASSCLVISTLNEIEALNALWDQIPFDEFDEVLVLDGGSTDGTLEFYRERNMPVVHGIFKGEIFNVAAMLSDSEYVVWFAPDGNEDPADILPLLQEIRDEGHDMAIARRFGPGARNEEDDQFFRWRSWANQTFSFLVRLRWGGGLYDSINGFRSLKRSAMFKLDPEPTGFDIEFQMSIRALKLGLDISEIPSREGDRIGGESTAYSFPTGWLMLKRLVKELFSGPPEDATGRRLQAVCDLDALSAEGGVDTRLRLG